MLQLTIKLSLIHRVFFIEDRPVNLTVIDNPSYSLADPASYNYFFLTIFFNESEKKNFFLIFFSIKKTG
jgi:hypothetical protein